jgi:hypothetical protein
MPQIGDVEGYHLMTAGRGGELLDRAVGQAKRVALAGVLAERGPDPARGARQQHLP